ncbi:unnamed protein product [Amoebophrya sp. A25]|nr:unnamed protein product [Amoebophrya sp. A25]|eukprot:GSA25T00021031001.1
MQEEAKKEMIGSAIRRKKQLLEGENSGFRRLLSRGPKRPQRKAHGERYKCFVCDLAYTTSEGAMRAHWQQHKEGQIIKVGTLKKSSCAASGNAVGAARRIFRPETHTFNKQTGKQTQDYTR